MFIRRLSAVSLCICAAFGAGVPPAGAQALMEYKGFGFGAGLGAAVAGQKFTNATHKLTPDQAKQLEAKCSALAAEAAAKEKTDPKAAAAKLQELAMLREQNLGIADKQSFDAYMKAADLYQAQNEPAACEGALRKALANCSRRNGPGSEHAVPLLDRLSNLCAKNNNSRDSLSFLRQSLAIQERKNPGDEGIQSRRNEAAQKSMQSGDFASAEALLRDALDSAERKAPNSSASSPFLKTYVESLRKQGKNEQAVAAESAGTAPAVTPKEIADDANSASESPKPLTPAINTSAPGGDSSSDEEE